MGASVGTLQHAFLVLAAAAVGPNSCSEVRPRLVWAVAAAAVVSTSSSSSSPNGLRTDDVVSFGPILWTPPQDHGFGWLASGPKPEWNMQVTAARDFQDGVEGWTLQSILESIKGFVKSAQKGYGVGEYCFRWGQYHELPPADYVQAKKWYERGARLKHVRSMAMLGKLYYMKGNLKDASKWWELIATYTGNYCCVGPRGDSLAQWFLGEANLQTGALRKAVRWWKRSAENGDVDAMMRLVKVFSEGAPGIPKETMRARHWLYAAAAHGHKDALASITWKAGNETRPAVEQRWMENMEGNGWL